MILNKSEYMFMDGLSRDEFKTFRLRFIGIILATDMARHTSDLAKVKNVMMTKAVKLGANREHLIDLESLKKEFDSKQVLIELCVHAADVSTQTRPFDVALEWTKLLFEEFFH